MEEDTSTELHGQGDCIIERGMISHLYILIILSRCKFSVSLGTLSRTLGTWMQHKLMEQFSTLQCNHVPVAAVF